MRDPKRIDRIVEALREAWKRTPDQRLGQLVICLMDNPEDDPWHVEDSHWERLLVEWVEKHPLDSYTGYQWGDRVRVGNETWIPLLYHGRVTRWVLLDRGD